jgi:hypothetical protein
MDSDEMLQQYVEKMGTELGPLFHAASSELTWMHWRWKQFRILFGEKPSRLDLLNQAAPFFFQTVHQTLFELTMLGIARLIGPPKSVGNANLSLQAIPPLCGDKIRDEVGALVDKAKDAGAFAVARRHLQIAHLDLALSLGKSTRLLEVVTREKIENSLLSLRNVLNRVEQEYCKAETLYASPTPWDAESLLYVIRDGLLREKDRQACWNRGENHEDDIHPLGPI